METGWQTPEKPGKADIVKSYNLLLPDNVNIYFETRGKGEPLLLIAGLGGDSRSWVAALEDLSRDFMVIALDNRGAGRSTQLGIPVSISAMAADCIAVLDYLGLQSACLVGHSMGGLVALECAINYASRVSALVLAATTTKSSAKNNALFRAWAEDLQGGVATDQWLMEMFPWLFSARFLEDRQAVESSIRRVCNDRYAQAPEAFRSQVEAIADFNCSARITEIKAPTLILHGCEDLLFPASESVERLALISGARSMVLGKAAHLFPLEQPGEFCSAVRKFLLS